MEDNLNTSMLNNVVYDEDLCCYEFNDIMSLEEIGATIAFGLIFCRFLIPDIAHE